MPDSSAEDFPCGWDDDDASRPVDIPPDLVPPADSEMPLQGMWLTATAWLPPETLSPGSAGPAGFGQGGAVDQMSPGPALATFTANAATPETAGEEAGLQGLSDEELTGVIRGWRKLSSWAQAGELAAVAELAARRHAEAKAAGEWDSTAIDAADDEIAAALTLTSCAASALIDRAAVLRELPATFSALAAGRIDMPRALVVVTGLAGQDPALARRVEAQVIDAAPAQTTGKLRAALHQALLAADPAAAERRREAEEKRARIERSPEPGGVTASLTGRNLPVTATVAAWNRITALARQLKTNGAPGTLDQLRVHVFLALLSGQATTPATSTGAAVADPQDGGSSTEAGGDTRNCSSTEAASGNRPPGPADADRPGPSDQGDPRGADSVDGSQPLVPAGPAGSGKPSPGTAESGRAAGSSAGPVDAGPVTSGTATAGPDHLTGTVNLTVPLNTLLGMTDSPGELDGFGPITAHTAREFAAGALGAPAVRWCVTVTGESGQAIGHGCATRARAAPGTPGWTLTMKITALADTDCGHQRESSHYRPPPSLWHLVQVRNPRCTAPGCRMPAARCDDDHTLAFEKGGRTCECNLGPLCRHHHRVKQSRGWRLEQPEPGIYVWVTPAGWQYITGPENYAA